MVKRLLIGLSMLALAGCGSEQAAVNLSPGAVVRGSESILDLRARQEQLLVEHQRRVALSLQNLTGKTSTPEVQAFVQGLQGSRPCLRRSQRCFPATRLCSACSPHRVILSSSCND